MEILTSVDILFPITGKLPVQFSFAYLGIVEVQLERWYNIRKHLVLSGQVRQLLCCIWLPVFVIFIVITGA